MDINGEFADDQKPNFGLMEEINKSQELADDHKPNLEKIKTKMETKPKVEERPPVHRNVGKISVENYRRRRLLSISIKRPIDFDSNFKRTPNRTQLQPNKVTASTSAATSIRRVVDSITVPAPDDNIVEPAGSFVAQQSSQPRDVQSPQQSQQPIQSPQQTQQPIPTQGTFCSVCIQNFKTRGGLKQHEKSKKHKTNLDRIQNPQNYQA